jgi:hypothetical protein
MATQGTMDIDSLLANTSAFQTISNFGIEEFAQAVQADLNAHDRNLRDMISGIADITQDRLWASAVSADMQMFEADEYSHVPTQEITGGYNYGAPLRKRQIAVGWTREYFRRKTVSEFAAQLRACEKAHVFMMYRDIRRAIWLSTNYTFAERLQDPLISIPVKRLYNADSLGIPTGPNGEVFTASSHTHYLGSATLTAAAVILTVNTVMEHRITSGLRIVISQTDRTAFEGLAGFRAYPDPRVQYNATDQNRQTIQLDRMNDLAIGTFSSAEVWVKPWAIANYVLVYDNDGPKPLALRVRDGILLETAAENDLFPLHAKFLESHYGVAVRNRAGAAILYFANATYADPTIS